MILTREQIDNILSILDYHMTFTTAVSFGRDALSKDELKSIVAKTPTFLASKDILPSFDKMFLLGRLTSILSDAQINSLDYKDLLKYFKQGQYVPLTERERYELDIARRKSYTHLKGLKQRAIASFENTLLDEDRRSRALYESSIKEAIETGVERRRSLQSIVSDLGHKLGTWQHDWGRIVDTEMNNVFQLGRARSYAEEYGQDVMVGKNVYPGACRHCIDLYLTKGIGSKPKLYKLSDLEANGDNIGRKVKDWRPTIGSTHPFCRCTIFSAPPGYVWDDERGMFDIPKDFERKVQRTSKIKIKVGDKEFVR